MAAGGVTAIPVIHFVREGHTRIVATAVTLVGSVAVRVRVEV